MSLHTIGYAYPSSPMAKRCGHARKGCYYLQIDGTAKGFPSYGEAVQATQHTSTTPDRWSLDHPDCPAAFRPAEATT